MYLFVTVIFFMLLGSFILRLMLIAHGQYPMQKTTEQAIAESILDMGFVVWAGIILWA